MNIAILAGLFTLFFSRLSEALGRRLPLFGRRLDGLVVAGVQNGQLQ